MRNVTDDRALPQCIEDHTVQDMDVLSQAQRVRVADNIDAHTYLEIALCKLV